MIATRWALRIEYAGGGFIGWQKQAAGVSVQAVLEAAASRLAFGAPVSTVAAGRTDAGVHARGQVAHLDLADDVRLTPDRLRDALNFHMKPHPIVVLQAAMVGANWNARFSAVQRVYRYKILNRAARPALGSSVVWHVKHPLDVAAMGAAASRLLGRHDFTSFRASACQANSPIRTLDRLEVHALDGARIEVRAEARSFLHHQVRNMVGTLKLVGEGRWEPDRVALVLAARDRAAAGPTAPPEGLCLMAVGYGDADPFAAGMAPDKAGLITTSTSKG